MTPDADYIRGLLRGFTESGEPTTDIQELQARGFSYETPEFYFHMRLLNEAGFVERDDENAGIGVSSTLSKDYVWSVLRLRLTDAGHEFAAAMANDAAFQELKHSSLTPSVQAMRDIAVAALTENRRRPASSVPEQREGTKVFIGHGSSHVWLVLKNFLEERLGLECEEFNAESAAGLSTTQRLQTMLNNSFFAFLVMTGEDEHADGEVHARENVVHEAGLFQGRLGFERAIILLEEGCAQFSNIHGLTTIRFPKGNIEPAFEKIRSVLERERVNGTRAESINPPRHLRADTEEGKTIAQQAAATYIPHMTETERNIIGYLLAHNQTMFTNTPDCGHARTLLSRGIVVIAARHGQPVTYHEVPFEIPDHIWAVLKEHQAEFPYTPPAPGITEIHPWRVHWMER